MWCGIARHWRHSSARSRLSPASAAPRLPLRWDRDPSTRSRRRAALSRTCRALSLDARQARIANREPHACASTIAAALATAPSLSFWEEGIGPGGEHGRLPAAPERWGRCRPRPQATSHQLTSPWSSTMPGRRVTTVTRCHDLFHATESIVCCNICSACRSRSTPPSTDRRRATTASSPSAGDRSLRSLRQAGVTPQHIRRSSANRAAASG